MILFVTFAANLDVQTVEFSWRAEGTEEFPSAQIDLIIRRADRIINLCEMKFSISDYLLDKSDDASLRRKIAIYQRLTLCKESIHPVLVTTYGLVANKYSLCIQKIVTMDDLFA